MGIMCMAGRRLAGILLLLSSVVTGFWGFILFGMYEGTVEYYNVAVFYPAIYVGILNLSAVAFCVAGGVALLKRKYIPLSLVGVFLLLASGIASPIAWAMHGYIWSNGLIVGAPHIAISVCVLVLMVISKGKP